jgi:nucleoside-diphosphate-sugar epimerase
MIGDGRCLRHPVYIDDMCAGFHLSATVSAARGRTYIIGGAEAVPVHDLVEAVARTVGTRVRLVKLAPGIALPLFRAVETAFLALGKKPPVSPRSMKFFTQQTCYDISRARRELGYEPAVSLEEGLRRTWDAMNVRNLRKSQPATGA